MWTNVTSLGGAEKEKLLSQSVLNFVVFGFKRFTELDLNALGSKSQSNHINS